VETAAPPSPATDARRSLNPEGAEASPRRARGLLERQDGSIGSDDLNAPLPPSLRLVGAAVTMLLQGA
jgi:hypothetical protein